MESAGDDEPRVVFTIGVYDWTLPLFLSALAAAEVGLLIDVRQRRGVRGGEYAWANAQRLQKAVAQAGFTYAHHKELAPTTELRHLQYREDDRLGVGKRSRVRLDEEYTERYLHEILEPADLDLVVSEMPPGRATALLCVERDAEACHRSLIAARLAEEYGCVVAHLLPVSTWTKTERGGVAASLRGHGGIRACGAVPEERQRGPDRIRPLAT